MKTTRAFILAGGLGTRLRTLVNDRPKSLAQIGAVPFLEHQLKFLKASNVNEFVFCVGYRFEQIRDYFDDGRRWDVSIRYSIENEPLGTGGALKLAEQYVDGTFLVLNGDTFFDLNVSDLLNSHLEFCHREPSTLGTLALTQVEDPSIYGTVLLDAANAIARFQEKSVARVPDQYVSAGVYVLEPRLLSLIPPSQTVSLERETFPQVSQSGNKLFGHRTKGFFVDIGTPQGYFRFRDYAGGISS